MSELVGTDIDQVFIGSCTNGRLEDLAVAAKILEGKTVACRTIITPASRKIYIEAIKAGYMETLAKAGAIITQPGCGLCCGRAGGILCDGEKVLATNNRNFLGRMGTSKVGISSVTGMDAEKTSGNGHSSDQQYCRYYKLCYGRIWSANACL